MSRIKRILLTFVAVFGMLSPAAVPALVHAAGTTADIDGKLCEGANLEVGTVCDPINDTAATQGVNNLIGTVINIFSIVVGVVAVIMIIVGGLKYITSGGDSGNITGAKNTILYAVVGLVVVALAQILVRFVLQRTTQAANV